MAHFARIEDGIVREVIVVNNDAINDMDFPASEPLGQAFLRDSGFTGVWLQCSYSGSFRSVYPGIGWVYDDVTDSFIGPDSPDMSEV